MSDPYPEHAKLLAKRTESTTLSGFLDWLEEEMEWHLCELRKDDELHFVHVSKERIIGAFLGIDPDALSKEKDKMLEDVRAANAAHAAEKDLQKRGQR